MRETLMNKFERNYEYNLSLKANALLHGALNEVEYFLKLRMPHFLTLPTKVMAHGKQK